MWKLRLSLLLFIFSENLLSADFDFEEEYLWALELGTAWRNAEIEQKIKEIESDFDTLKGEIKTTTICFDIDDTENNKKCMNLSERLEVLNARCSINSLIQQLRDPIDQGLNLGDECVKLSVFNLLWLKAPLAGLGFVGSLFGTVLTGLGAGIVGPTDGVTIAGYCILGCGVPSALIIVIYGVALGVKKYNIDDQMNKNGVKIFKLFKDNALSQLSIPQDLLDRLQEISALINKEKSILSSNSGQLSN